MSALSNARWLILIQGYKISLQLVAMAVLTRLLPPSDYGLMAMAWTAANFASLLKDLGTSSAIIQKKDLTEQTKSAVFWLQMGLGTLLCLSLIALSGVISAAFKQPSLQPILCLLALTFPIGSLSTVHQALLERQSRFHILARMEIVASSTALVVAIFSAWQGAGVYSFVWQSFTITFLYVAQAWISLKWLPKFEWDRDGIKQIFGYSGNLSAFNLINFFARNADSMIIGRFLGATALGTYSMAYKLMLFPLQNLTNVAGRALFPIISRQQDSNVEIAHLYVRTVAMVAAVSTPLMAGLYTLRHPLSRIVFGGPWGDVALVITWLAPVGALQAIVGITGAIYAAKGRTDILFRIGVLSSIVVVGSFFAGLQGGVVGVALCYFIANFLMFIPQTYFAARLIKLPYLKYLKALFAPLFSSVVMVPLVTLCFDQLSHLGDLPALVIASCAGGLVYFVCYIVLFRNASRELLRALFGSRFKLPNVSKPDGETSNWILIDIAEDFGGHEVMLLRWIQEMKDKGRTNPVLVCLKGTRLALQAAPFCEVIAVAGPDGRAGKMGQLSFFIRLTSALFLARWRRKPELAVVAEGCLFAQRHGLYAARLALLYTVMYVPILSSFASMGFAQGARLDRKVQRFYGKLPHAWLTITTAQADEFRAWAGVRQPIFTLPNTVQSAIECQSAEVVEKMCNSERDGSLKTSAAEPLAPMRILVLGRLEPYQKGLDLLLAHLKSNPELSERFVVQFTGEGPYEETLRQEKANDARLDRLMVLAPWGNPLEVFAQHDVLLLPSRFEGVPLVMLEAMALGMPVVASDLAGTRTYLPGACLFPVGDVEQMFKCLSVMHQSKTRIMRIAHRNIQAFKNMASGEAFAKAVEELTGQLRQASKLH